MKEKNANPCKINSCFVDKQGISLVALIITIIVMVILAGIIIVSAVADGGIIDRAKQALKEQECADVQEIIISSYVYEATATTGNSYAFIDLGKTAESIFDNLTSNGFEIVGADSVDDFYTPGDTELDLEVKGDHGTYEGTVDKEGLQDDLIWQPEEDDDNDDNDDNDDDDQVADLEKLRKYFVGNVIYNPSEKTGLYNLESGSFNSNEDLEDANEIIMAPPQLNFKVGDVKDFAIKYNGVDYCLTIEVTGESNASMIIKGKSVNIAEPNADDLEMLRKCMKDKEVLEEMIGREETFTHEDGSSVTVQFDTSLFQNSDTEAILKITYRGTQYIITITMGENVIISEVNMIEDTEIYYGEFYTNNEQEVSIIMDEKGMMTILDSDGSISIIEASIINNVIYIVPEDADTTEEMKFYMYFGKIENAGKDITVEDDGEKIILEHTNTIEDTEIYYDEFYANDEFGASIVVSENGTLILFGSDGSISTTKSLIINGYIYIIMDEESTEYKRWCKIENNGKHIVMEDGSEKIIFEHNGEKYEIPEGIENVVYENQYMQLVLYKNGMFTMGYTWYINSGNTIGQFTGVYEYNETTHELKIDGISDDLNLTCIVADDFSEITTTCDLEVFNGTYKRNLAKTANYSPEFNEKGIFTKAIYINESKTNAISVGETYICLKQSGNYGNLVDTKYAITISKFDKDTNTTISVSEDGKTITYNGEDYKLVTADEMNNP